MNRKRMKLPQLMLCSFGACLLHLCINPVAAEQPLSVRLSVGSSWQTRNDVQIPNSDQGTRFSLRDAVGSGPVPAARLEMNWSMYKRHGLRIMLAPLSYSESVEFDQPVDFDGQRFAANETTRASYRFNSWRVGYHYTFLNNEVSMFRAGATLKVRDAEIRLGQSDADSSNDDVGIVPLLYLAGSYKLNDSWKIRADLDGLAGGPGRAIDAGLALDFALTKRWSLGAEVRILDGGADTDDVYNFAQFNSAAVALSAEF